MKPSWAQLLSSILAVTLLHLPSVLALASSLPKVAVVGSGASGLAAARALSKHGFEPLVLEKEANAGGVWDYRKDSKIHPVYRGLRTNLPKEIMAYREYPFQPMSQKPEEDTSFLSHKQVLGYLQAYEKHFDLTQYIQFGCQVSNLQVLQGTSSIIISDDNDERWPKIRLEWEDSSKSTKTTNSEIFDAVLVCNGHYAKPSMPNIPGAKDYFSGKLMHSIEYDNPLDFQDQTVLCVGARASGEDVAREVAQYAKHVYLSSSTCSKGQAPQTKSKVTLVPRTMEVCENGAVRFDGYDTTANFDAIIYCTGYDYDFPFINDKELLSFIPGERRVQPLVEQLFHARHPNLSFLGLPHSILPFPLFELQAEAVVAVLKGIYRLPSLSQRIEMAAQDAASGGPAKDGRVPQDTHYLGKFQWSYIKKLASMAGLDNDDTEQYIDTTKMIWDHTSAERKGRFPGGPDVYREIVYQRDDGRASFEILNDVSIRAK